MKRKTTFLTKAAALLFVMLLSLTGARAQEVLTVYDGTATNKYIPVYAYSGDTQGTTSEFVIPAAELTAMKDGTITQMAFYLSQSASKDWTAVYKVYLAEVSETTLSGTVGPDACTVVYTGTVDGSGSTMNITFDNYYTYNGGNLLVGTYVQTKGAWDNNGIYYGVEATSAAYLSGSWGGSDDGVKNFIPKTTFTYFPAGAILPPTGLTVNYTVGTEATVSWTSTESAFDIEVNGVETSNITTNTYTLTSLEYATTYTVRVRAKKNGEVSDWTDPVTFRTASSANALMINYSLADSYGDGWNGNAINVLDEDGNVVQSLTISSGNSNSGTLDLENGAHYEFVWVKGSYPGECSWTFTDLGGNVLFSGTGDSNMATGDLLYEINPFTYDKPTNLAAGTPDTHSVELSWTANSTATSWQICVNDDVANAVAANSNPFTLTGLDADTEYSVKVRAYIDNDNKSGWSNVVTFTTAEAAPKPTNLVASNITTTSATLSWSGTNDSYVVQYRPWTQVGEDQLATEEFVTYTYDLSEYSGTGSIAIRHYDVTDVFYLNIDNVELKDAEGTVILSEDFESGSIPSTWTNYDVDGDGYTWGLAQTGSMNVIGNYGVYSASWISGVGALTPDNWLIIPNVALGGTFSFAARGQDPNYPAENFAVYVSADADFTEVPVTGTSYNAEGLIPGTPYAWQVKGITGTEESKWVTSLFKTKDDVLIFANDGDWSSLSNWTDVNGDPVTALPTSDNKVRIDADAVIPSGVIAYAGKTTINGGSITIKDGGELKHKAATLKVTMEKEITAGKNNFIASPFSGSTQLSYNDSWSHVLNVTTGNYDLYGFDPTAEEEWINYENDNEHAVFASGNNYGLRYCDGYFCANEADQTLQFTGVTPSSVNNSMTTVVDYDATSEAPFNGWKLIGNPYVCTGYITYSEPATFYKMNAAGTGLVAYENAVALAPGEGAFMKVAASGTITYSSEPLAVEPVSAGAFNNIALPAHGETTDQDANTTVVQFADNGDNTALIESLNGQTVDVQLTGRRLYKDGSWNTICLPFDIKDFTGTPLEGADMRALGSVNYNSSTSTMTLSFSPAGDDTKVAAGRPYIIRWTDGDDISDPVFENVTIDKTTYTDTEYTFANDVKISFKGTYDYMSFTDVNRSILFMGAENKLYYPGAGAEIGAFRAYFELEGITAGDPASVPIKFRLQFTEDDATGISNLDADADETIYNLAGQRINKAQKGVNIVNGKKILK